eukprot:616961-Lingulodinium_polyedra.AAC.1
MITFDGGARTISGHKAAAGAAIAWVRRQDRWEQLASSTILLPGGDNSLFAEDWAARMALQLSSRPGMPPGPITVVGDNLGI